MPRRPNSSKSRSSPQPRSQHPSPPQAPPARASSHGPSRGRSNRERTFRRGRHRPYEVLASPLLAPPNPVANRRLAQPEQRDPLQPLAAQAQPMHLFNLDIHQMPPTPPPEEPTLRDHVVRLLREQLPSLFTSWQCACQGLGNAIDWDDTQCVLAEARSVAAEAGVCLPLTNAGDLTLSWSSVQLLSKVLGQLRANQVPDRADVYRLGWETILSEELDVVPFHYSTDSSRDGSGVAVYIDKNESRMRPRTVSEQIVRIGDEAVGRVLRDRVKGSPVVLFTTLLHSLRKQGDLSRFDWGGSHSVSTLLRALIAIAREDRSILTLVSFKRIGEWMLPSLFFMLLHSAMNAGAVLPPDQASLDNALQQRQNAILHSGRHHPHATWTKEFLRSSLNNVDVASLNAWATSTFPIDWEV